MSAKNGMGEKEVPHAQVITPNNTKIITTKSLEKKTNKNFAEWLPA